MTAPFKILIFHRHGAFEPSTTHWLPDWPADWQGVAGELADWLKTFHSNTAAISRAEVLTYDNTNIDGMTIGLAGTSGDDFDSFKDCTYITWASAGPKHPSGIYIPGRIAGLWSKGVPQGPLTTALAGLVGAMTSNNICDSDGQTITGYARVKPSRRERMRLAE